ncbi:MAG: carboxypeptidase-like regulatory domain-containing protein [Myxococcaceae bacterium]
MKKRAVPIFIAVLALGAVIVGAAYEQCEPSSGGAAARADAPRASADPFTAPPPVAKGQATLRGRVIGSDGKPAPGVAVIAVEAEGNLLSARACHCGDELVPGKSLAGCPCEQDTLIAAVANREGEPMLLARTESASDGSFELSGLPDAPVALWAQHPVLGVAVLEKALLGDHPDLILAPAVELAGTVTDTTQKPLAGALVTVIAEPSSRFFETVTDAKGAFKRGGLPHTAFRVVTSLKGYLSDVSAIDADETLDLRVTLDAPKAIAGKVVRQGQPVEGASVIAGNDQNDALLRVTSAADGSFRFEGLSVPMLHLTATKGFELATVGLYDEEAPTGLVLELKPAGRVEGTVVDEERRPVPGALVMLTLPEQGSQDTRAGADGHFELLGLAGLGELQAIQKGFLERDPMMLKVQAGQTQQVTISLSRGAVVSGVVVDPSGRPVVGASVSENDSVVRQKHGARARYSTSTGPDGRFLLKGLDVGKTTLLVKHEAWQFKRVDVEAPSTELEVKLEAGATVEGHLREADGAPVIGGRVAAVPDDKIDMHGNGGPSLVEVKETRTRGDGSYRLEGVEPRSYLFTGRDQPTFRTTMTQATVSNGANSVELTFEAGLPLGGVVTDQDGKPVPRVRLDVIWTPARRGDQSDKRHRDVADILTGPTSRNGESDDNGKFLFKSLPNGKVRLAVYAEGYQGEPPLELETGDTAVRVVLRRLPRMTGKVAGPDRAPVTRFYVGGIDVRDPAGHFDIAREGAAKLVVVAEGFAPSVLEVPEGENDLELGTVVLSRGRSVEVEVTDARTAAPIEGVRAIVSTSGEYLAGNGMDDTTDGASSDARGVLSLSRVPEAELSVALRKEGYLPGSVTVPPGAATVQARLDPGEPLEGRVVDAKGNPVAHAAVQAMGEGEGGYQRTGADGRFQLTGLSPGNWTLSAEDSEHKLTFAPRPVKLEAGKPAVVELRAMSNAASLDVRLFDTSGEELLGQVRLVQGVLPGTLTRDAFFQLRTSALKPTGRSGHFEAIEPGTYTALIVSGGNTIGVSTQQIEVARGENVVKVVLSATTPRLNLSE